MNVMLGVRDITNTSATLDWMVPDDKPIVGFKVGSESIKIAVSFTWMIFLHRYLAKGMQTIQPLTNLTLMS